MQQVYDVDLQSIQYSRVPANYGGSGLPEQVTATATFSLDYTNRGKESGSFDLVLDASGRENDITRLCWEELHRFSSHLVELAAARIPR